MKAPTRLYGVVLAALFTAVVGCAGRPSQPPQLLVLTPLVGGTDGPGRASAALPGLVVGPIDLPAYTERAQVLILTNAAEMHASTTARWAEPLDENFSRVLVDNLSRLLGTGQITTLGGVQTQATVQITVEVTEFVTTDTGQARLTAYWQVLGDGGHALLAHEKLQYEAAVEGGDYPARAAALSTALAALSRDIAGAVRRIASHTE